MASITTLEEVYDLKNTKSSQKKKWKYFRRLIEALNPREKERLQKTSAATREPPHKTKPTFSPLTIENIAHKGTPTLSPLNWLRQLSFKTNT